MARFTATLRENTTRFEATLRGSEQFAATMGSYQVVVDVDDYDGPYEFIPSDSAQTIPAAGLRLVQDVVIDPIPSNYGRITWNGLGIRVS